MSTDRARSFPVLFGFWLAGAAAAAGLSAVVSRWACHAFLGGAVLAGWGLAAANAAAMLGINARALRHGAGGRAFALWGVVGNALRIAAVLATIMAVILSWQEGVKPFLAAFLPAYFAFLFAEVAGLYWTRLREERR